MFFDEKTTLFGVVLVPWIAYAAIRQVWKKNIFGVPLLTRFNSLLGMIKKNYVSNRTPIVICFKFIKLVVSINLFLKAVLIKEVNCTHDVKMLVSHWKNYHDLLSQETEVSRHHGAQLTAAVESL